MSSSDQSGPVAGAQMVVDAQTDVGARKIAPLYKRLPRGPHGLVRNEVIRNQRARIHGAMVEATAQSGYEGASVKQIVALAGVSRRAFYEHFANKQDCFLQTLGLLSAHMAKRANAAYRAADGDLEHRLRAAFEQFTEDVDSNWKSVSLVVVEAPAAGAAGVAQLCRVTARVEQMLLSSFAHAPEMGALPLPVIRGIVGSLHEVLSIRLRTGRAKEIPALTEELPRWTLLFGTSAPDHLAERLAERARVNVRSTDGANATNPNNHSSGDASHLDPRARLLQSVLRLTVLEDYAELNALQIADEADVPLDDFFELFVDKEECFLAAFDAMSDELLTLTADPELVGDDWPHAVRHALGALMRHLADHPPHAQIIAAEVYAAGPDAIERNHELTSDIATLLTEGAPEGAGGTFALDAVSGAIWHTVRCQVASAQIQLLPALTDYLSYVVLAPFIGADAAAELVTEDA
jgi:AcrR family transcriptional regulator